MSVVTLGGDRLGAGKKQKIDLHNYSRSNHDLSYVWRSTMASGTLVPFMSEVGLPGDSFDIDLNVDIKTHPTIGPLFGSYKVQLDVFTCPVRLYNGKLHMNMLNIGLNMSQIKLPQLVVEAKTQNISDNSQINPSCLLSYLNIRGVGRSTLPTISRKFNAIPYLTYWDIYKNYYANKQEEVGAYIHNPQNNETNEILEFYINVTSASTITLGPVPGTNLAVLGNDGNAYIVMANGTEPDYTKLFVKVNGDLKTLTDIFENVIFNEETYELICNSPKEPFKSYEMDYMQYIYNGEVIVNNGEKPNVEFFPLENIDNMRQFILTNTLNPNAFLIDQNSAAPYGNILQLGGSGKYSKESTQEGLALKTYQSDLNNNWISTDWIDGENGINSITAVQVDAGTNSFTIDTLQLSKKVYDMLNRIAVSGGSYDDWLDAVYTHERTRSQENPMYMGGLIKELAFQEVISNASATNTNDKIEQPLGTLAGKGILTKKNKGGKINIKVSEPCYIMGIISLTPRIDYSQGNKWDVNLKTMDDFHKPALDEIGFEDKITDSMAWWDTEIVAGLPVYSSVGKQPAWINYMSNVNVCRGNFAEKNEQMFMTLNRRYEQDALNNIKDLTTYIDPSKFNNIFADTRIDAQNFWAQIGVGIKARRKMSAKLMPNL